MWASTILLVTLGALVPRAAGYGSGAPEDACESMVPQHGSDPQTSPAPYNVRAIPSQDPEGRPEVTVTVEVTKPDGHFKGFLIQARLQDDRSTIVPGTFRTLPDGFSQLLDCSGRSAGDSITQTNNVPKSSFTTMWSPPPGFDGTIVMKATLVQDAHTFWVDQYSDPIAIAAPATSSRQTPLRGETLPISRPSQTPLSSPYQDCNLSKGCVGIEGNCVANEDCAVLLSYRVDTDQGGILFELTDFQPRASRSYVAMALSTDHLMGDDSVTECVFEDASLPIQVRQSWNSGRSNQPLQNTQLGISNPAGRQENGMLTCTWRREMVTEVESRIFDMANQRYHIHLAKGGLWPNGNLMKHSLARSSQSSVNLTAISIVGGASTSPLVKAHGGLMVVAWMLLVNLGIVLARHYKPLWDNTNIMGVKVWFFLHRGFMVTAISLMVISLILIFVAKGGWSSTNFHTVIGIIAFGLAFLQPFMAMLRPGPTDEKRYIFNWCHWTVGNVAHLLAIVTIFLAARLSDTSYVYPALYYPLSVYVAAHLFSHIVLHSLLWFIDKKRTNEVRMVEIGKETSPKPMPDKTPPGAAFKKAFLFVYSTGCSFIVLAILILIWVTDQN